MNNLYLGIMSGTSMDAIDVVAASFDAQQPSIHATHSELLPHDYKQQYLEIINSGQCSLATLGTLDNWTGELFATAVLNLLNNNNIKPTQVAAIGSHGQTLWHAPNETRPFTMQIGDPNVIAAKTRITTVADFRRADIAAGGQGAPLAPALHRGVFAKPGQPRCIVNVGGFSNISVLEDDRYLGFDPGPGNCLLDYWVKTHFDQEFDKDGALSTQGKISDQLLQTLLNDPYIQRAAPKSTGREHFNPAWLNDKLNHAGANDLALLDVLATLLEFTATTISTAIKQNASPQTQVYVCGGGVKNLALMQALSRNLEQTVLTTNALGIDPMRVEGLLFAWLAHETLAGHALDLGAVTGSKKPVVLGGIYKACNI